MNNHSFASSHYDFFRDATKHLLGVSLADHGLAIATWEQHDQVIVRILGSLPSTFSEVCMAKWGQVGSVGWDSIMTGKVCYEWDASEDGGGIFTIPSLATAFDLIVDYVPPIKVEVAEPPSCSNDELIEVDHRAPYTIARQLISSDWTWHSARSSDIGPTLIHLAGDFFCWDGRRYKHLPDGALRSELYQRMSVAIKFEDGAPFNPDNSKITKIMDAIRAVAYRDGDSGTSFWLDGDDEEPRASTTLISVEDGLLEPLSKCLRPHSPKYFTRNTIPVHYGAGCATVPVAFSKFLEDCWPGDLDSQRLLQQMFGAALLGHNKFHKICLLIGPPRSGKGTLMRLLTALLGAENVAGPTLGDFATQFGLAPLIGKRAAIVGDARFAGRPEQVAQVVSKLLSISGGDTLTVDRKHREPWVGRLDAQLFICTNELPRLADSSGALASRFCVLQMTQSHLGKEDAGLEARLHGELQGIFIWALNGLTDLINSGHFIQPASSRSTMSDLAALASPVADFVDEHCELAPGRMVLCQDLYQGWCVYCKQQGFEHPGSLQMFSRDLRAAFPQLKTEQCRSGANRGKRAFVGIGLQQSHV